MLNLYASPFSPYVTKVQYFLEESGIPYQYHQLNLRDPAGRAEIDRLNPFGKVPTIELNGFTLGESAAILRYLCERFERYDYLPRNLEDQARINALTEFVTSHVAGPVQKLAFNLTYGPRYGFAQPDERAMEMARTELARTLPRFEAVLHGRQFLAGPQLTLADFQTWPLLAENKAAHLSYGDYPAVQAYVDRMAARPAWQKTRADIERRVGEAMKAMGG